MTRRLLYVASYDIAKPNRRRRVHSLVKRYATGGQKSAYECFLTHEERSELSKTCISLIDPAEDRFALLPVEMKSAPIVSGIAVLPTNPTFFYIG